MFELVLVNDREVWGVKEGMTLEAWKIYLRAQGLKIRSIKPMITEE